MVAPPVLELAEAERRLVDPFHAGHFSALEEPLVAVAMPAGSAPEAPLVAALDALAAVTVAVAEAPHAGTGAFDCVVSDAAALASLEAAVRRSPLASVALVQLLRGGEKRSVSAALVAESFVYSMLQAGPEFARWRATRSSRPPRAEATPPLRVERRGASLTLTLDRPEKRNAFSSSLRDALFEALTLAVLDDGVRDIHVAGSGPDFCSGGDLDEFGSRADPATAHAIRTTRSPARLLARLAERVTCHVHGACIGAGIELPAFARRVVATPDARFQLPEVGLGLIPGAGGSASLPRRIGRQRTALWALTGATIDAETALAWGLVDALEERG